MYFTMFLRAAEIKKQDQHDDANNKKKTIGKEVCIIKLNILILKSLWHIVYQPAIVGYLVVCIETVNLGYVQKFMLAFQSIPNLLSSSMHYNMIRLAT